MESKYSNEFLKQQEEIILKLLEEEEIEPTGYYHYYQQFPRENGEKQVRLAPVDAITNVVINDLTFDKSEFDKDLVDAFLDSSLENLPKEAIITDGATMYYDIMEKIGVKHQICVFHAYQKSS